MTPEETAPRLANAVRPPTATLFPFPADRVIRNRIPGHRGDQVAVTHRGETIVFDSPEEMYRHARESDPLAQAQRQEITDLQAAAELLAEAADHTLALATAARAHAERFLRLVGRTALLAIVVGAICLVGSL